MTNAKISRDWIGRTVDGKFPLLAWLGGSEGSGVFLTERQGESTGKAVIKLVPDEAAASRTKGWIAARGLNRPHLLRLYEYGRGRLDEADFLFVVTEFAPEVLAEILPERALTTDETRGVLEPLLDALECLHAQSMVHGHVKPTNILADGDDLKLTADHLLPVGDVPGGIKRGHYDAPEVALGMVTPAADVWSLGVTLVEILTQKRPVEGADGELVIPDGIPVPFEAIVRECLRVDAAARCSLQRIRERLTPAANAKPLAVNPVAKPAPARAAKPSVASAVSAWAGESPAESSSRKKVSIGGLVALVVVLIIAWFLVPHSHSHSKEKSTAAEYSQPVPRQESSATPAATPVTVKGSVAQRLKPDVAPGALATIRGTVRVDVRVSVNTDGNVADAEFADRGPSRYFADAAMKAAQQWKFHPAQVDGNPAKSVWLLKFGFTRGGDSITAAEVNP